MSSQAKPSIVFVHGIWADGSSFGKLIPTLQAEGHEVIAAQFGLDTLAGDVAAGATVVETTSSHVPMLSNPDLVLDVIHKAAAATQNA
jgi:pimeloyl-ACP methyl ester carboxylesterase